MRSFAPTTLTMPLLLLALAGMVAGSPGCGSTIVQGTSSSASGGGGVRGSGAGTGPASASSGHAASASSSGTGGGQGGSGTGGGGMGGGLGGGVTCSASEKVCDGKCVAVGDPAYGCTPTSCTACPGPPNAMLPPCVAGTCSLPECPPGYKDCDGNPNVCDTNIDDDPANCGACGAVCVIPHATAACDMGECAIATCDSGWTDCNNDPADGCEANLENDSMNCGTCGTICHGYSSLCQAWTCGGLAGCTKVIVNCAGDPPGVCATMLGTNQNCNFCGDTCDLPNATSNCLQDPAPPPAPGFVCTLQMCDAGFADCDMIAENGCEVDTNTDPNNCGGCGNVCATTCSGGVCAP